LWWWRNNAWYAPLDREASKRRRRGKREPNIYRGVSVRKEVRMREGKGGIEIRKRELCCTILIYFYALLYSTVLSCSQRWKLCSDVHCAALIDVQCTPPHCGKLRYAALQRAAPRSASWRISLRYDASSPALCCALKVASVSSNLLKARLR
jgi:hypothetical protein